VSRPIRVDMRREADARLAGQIQVWQNGEMIAGANEEGQVMLSFTLVVADEALGITEHAVPVAVPCETLFQYDRRGLVLSQCHGPVEIRPNPGSATAPEILRLKRAGEIP
jgi:hypothetical protein